MGRNATRALRRIRASFRALNAAMDFAGMSKKQKTMPKFYPSISFGRYCNASATCVGRILSSPAKSAMVRASFSTR